MDRRHVDERGDHPDRGSGGSAATSVLAAQHLQLALEAAVRGGRDTDTDTVAAIAGGLLGARWWASAVPAPWRWIVHGWPGMRGRDLIRALVAALDRLIIEPR